MLLKAGILKVCGIVSGVVLVPAVVVGGFYTIGAADKYRGLYANPTNDSSSGFLDAYRGAVQQGAEIVMTPGFNHQVPVELAINSNEQFYKNTGFLLLDSELDGKAHNTLAAANTWSINYRADLGSIQTGVAVAYFLNVYQDHFKEDENGKYDGLSFATWGGLPFPTVTSFMGGLQSGVTWANENLPSAFKTSTGKDWIEVEQVRMKGSEFTNGFGPSDGMGTQQGIVDLKPDALMPVAGPQTWTAQKLIQPNSKTVLIGADSAMENDAQNTVYKYKTADGKSIGNGMRVQFSSLKNLTRSIDTVLNIINNGNIIPEVSPEDPDRYKGFSETGSAGEIGGFGTIAIGDAANGCVGISEAGNEFFKEALEMAKKTDPSLDSKYNEKENMIYRNEDGSEQQSYDSLNSPFKKMNDEKIYKNLNKKNMIEQNRQSDRNKFKIILSSVTSILMDASFSQSTYTGLYTYLKSMGIDIPTPAGGK
ncbi:MAG: hypothetical protein ACRC42_03615 [Mycoplasma sp.]